MDEKNNLTPPSCFIETDVQETSQPDGTSYRRVVEKRYFTGDAANKIAEEQSKAIERESQAKAEGIKAGLTLVGAGAGMGALIALVRSSNTPAASTSSKAVTADTKIPIDHNVPGNGGGTA